MTRHKNIKKMIERTVDECRGSDLREVRDRLESALVALKKSESEKKNEETKSFQQKWKFDISTSSMRNLTQKQMDNVISNIEEMIELEQKKTTNGDRYM